MHARNLREYLQANKEWPRSIFVEITPHCNLRCPMCPCYPAGDEVYLKRSSTRMGMDRFVAIFEPLVGQFNFQVCFTYSGEPLLNRAINDMIEWLAANGVPNVIHTNGLLLERLTSMPDRVIVSLDGLSSRTYNAIRVGGEFEELTRQVQAYTSRRERAELTLQMIVTKENVHELDRLADYAREVGADKAYLKTLSICGVKDEVVDRLFIEHEVARYDKNRQLKSKNGCPEIQNCVLTVDGDVVPCCFDVMGKYRLGNAAERPLTEIWMGYKKFREEKMARRRMPMCGSCNTDEHITKQVYPYANGRERKVEGVSDNRAW